ncbi:MAG: N-acetyl-alpha-D-glucosaminyl L-malate synthase BshA [Saprospiraceae bacterium]|nr:N-acetyl-alpha-D-glucosaminyl L-malate synthase BshA [Saprospiraceae bacterium]
MRIGIVCYPTFGGSGVVATELGLGLAKKGHQVHFITYKRPARLSVFHENIYFHEVSQVNYPLFEYEPYDTSLTSKLVDVVKYENLDLLHVHYAIPHATVAYMAKKILLQQGKYLPVVTTLHGTDITLVGIDHSFAPVVEFSINKSDGITAVSQFLKDKTEEYFNIEKDIKVIHNFIDFTRFKKVDKNHFRKAIAPNDEKILMHISNFRKVKRVQDVIRVFKKVQDKMPAKLLMIGDGPERQNCEELCRSMGICGDIRFLGKQDAIEELLAVTDLFLLPSGNESFGLVALEAMACEVPVISSNVGGIPEVNIEGVTGFLSDIGDVEAMSANAIRILENPDMLAKFRANALAQAKNFDIEIILPQYEDYYLSILEHTRHQVV